MMPQEDPFASVRIKKSQPPSISNSESKNDPFETVRMKKEPSESVFDKILRGGTRAASRAAETILGIPGDLSSILQSGALYGLEKLSGKQVPSEAKERMKDYRLPTSQELQEFSENKSKGYTKPQNESEQEIDDFTKTLTSLLGPMKFRKALGLSVIGSGVGKGLETLGFDEPIKDAGKFGSIFALSMFNPKGVQNLYTNLYEKVQRNIPPISLNVVPLETRLNSIERGLNKGIPTVTKQAVLKPIQDLRSKIVNGHIQADDLIKARFDLNELMGDPELLKRGKNAFPLVTRSVNKAIKGSHQLGSQIKKDLTMADEAYGAFQQSKKASNFLKKVLPEKPLKHAIFAAGIEALAYPEALIPTAGAVAAGTGLIRGYEILSRINANPTMRKYYLGMLKSAAEENKTATLKFLHKLDQEFDKSSSSK